MNDSEDVDAEDDEDGASSRVREIGADTGDSSHYCIQVLPWLS